MKIYEHLKALGRGEVTLAELLGITLDEAKAFAKLGTDLAAAGRLEDARVVFHGLVAANPYDAAASAGLGAVFQQMGKAPEALDSYAAALQVEPNNVVALAGRGELRLHLGDATGADDLRRAVVADPNSRTAASRRAQQLLQSKGAAPGKSEQLRQ